MIGEKKRKAIRAISESAEKRRDGYGLKDQNHGGQQTNECGGIW